MLACVAVSQTRDPEPKPPPPPGATCDADLFRLVVDRVRQGDGFYTAAHEELIRHSYPTRSVFNWRTPFYAWMLASPPGETFWRGVLMALALFTVLAWTREILEQSGLMAATLGGVALVGATGWSCGSQTFLFTEVWAGLLIAVSAFAYHRGWRVTGYGLGLFALFYRELALPYAVVCLGLAVWHGRRREAVAWAVGLALFAAFLAYHAGQVHARLTDRDLAMVQGWLRLGGLRNVLRTSQTNVFVMALPFWCTAVYLPLAVLGLSTARGEGWERVALTGVAYLAAFSVAGNAFNFYWGFMDAPLLALGVARAPAALGSMIATAFPVTRRVRPDIARQVATG
jgi:hypothetical protein